MSSVCVLSDSRGRYVSMRYADNVFYRGATIEDIVDSYIRDFGENNHATLYLAGGINNTTIRMRSTGHVNMRSADHRIIMDIVLDEMQLAKSRLKREYPYMSIVVCPLYGLDIGVYNQVYTRHPRQTAIDTAVPEINRWVNHFNIQENAFTPRLANVIHRYMGPERDMLHLYDRLYDGLHPDWITSNHITHYLDRAIGNNWREGMHY